MDNIPIVVKEKPASADGDRVPSDGSASSSLGAPTLVASAYEPSPDKKEKSADTTEDEDEEKNSYFQNLSNQFYADAKEKPKEKKPEAAPALVKKNKEEKEENPEAEAALIQKHLEALKKDGGDQWLIILNEFMETAEVDKNNNNNAVSSGHGSKSGNANSNGNSNATQKPAVITEEEIDLLQKAKARFERRAQKRQEINKQEGDDEQLPKPQQIPIVLQRKRGAAVHIPEDNLPDEQKQAIIKAKKERRAESPAADLQQKASEVPAESSSPDKEPSFEQKRRSSPSISLSFKEKSSRTVNKPAVVVVSKDAAAAKRRKWQKREEQLPFHKTYLQLSHSKISN